MTLLNMLKISVSLSELQNLQKETDGKLRLQWISLKISTGLPLNFWPWPTQLSLPFIPVIMLLARFRKTFKEWVAHTCAQICSVSRRCFAVILKFAYSLLEV